MRIRTWLSGGVVLASMSTLCISDADATLATGGFPFTFVVAGTAKPDVNADVVAFTFNDQTGQAELTLKNWVNQQFKYSDGSIFLPDTPVSIYVGYGTSAARKIFEAKVVQVAPKYVANSAPTFVVALAGSGSTSSQGAAVPMAYGSGLFEFYPVLKADKSVACTGTMTGRTDVFRGKTLRITGVGNRFGGDYALLGTVHGWDPVRGYTVTFTGAKTAALVGPKTLR